jgi:LPXTG-motif cell wall-anchored protein
MSRKLAVLAVVAVVCLAFAVTAQAQVKTEVKQGTVVSVGNNFLVVKMADGTVKGVDVPPGFMFDVGGTQVPLSALKPGQVITATVTTTTKPVIEHTEVVKEGTVTGIADGRNLYVQMADGTYKHFVVPEKFLFDVEGQKLDFYQLQKGMKLSATIVSEKEIGTVTEKEVQAAASAPPPAAKPAAPPPPPPPPPAPAKKLPKTAGPLPLIGLLGLLSLGLGAGLSFRRRRE